MNVHANSFEIKWLSIFLFMYFFIMVPFPFFFNAEYVAGWLGVPLFVYGWIAHGTVVLALIVLFAHQCLKRPEYQEFTQEEENSNAASRREQA